jgi:hypothetical protein
MDFVLAAVKQETEAGAGVNAEMIVAFWTNLHRILQRFPPDDLTAMLAFFP